MDIYNMDSITFIDIFPAPKATSIHAVLNFSFNYFDDSIL